MNILIYGTSNQALQYLPALALHYTLLGFVDSDPAKQGTRWMNRPVYHPSQLAGLQFDHILIASSCVSEINQTLASYGVVPGIPVTQLTEVAQTRQDYDEALRAVRGRAEASAVAMAAHRRGDPVDRSASLARTSPQTGHRRRAGGCSRGFQPPDHGAEPTAAASPHRSLEFGALW